MYFFPYPLTVFPSCMLYINLLFCLLQRINKAHFILFNRNFPLKEGPELAWFANILIAAKKSKPAGMFSQKGRWSAPFCAFLYLLLFVTGLSQKCCRKGESLVLWIFGAHFQDFPLVEMDDSFDFASDKDHPPDQRAQNLITSWTRSWKWLLCPRHDETVGAEGVRTVGKHNQWPHTTARDALHADGAVNCILSPRSTIFSVGVIFILASSDFKANVFLQVSTAVFLGRGHFQGVAMQAWRMTRNRAEMMGV